MDKTKISVVIPVYNSEKYIEECINSITNQTYKNIEIIIVNDGSIDNSEKIIKEYALKDKRIKYIYKLNEGVSKARNTGIKISTGKYITFVDSDDIVEKNYLHNLINKNDEYDFVMMGYKIWNMKKNSYQTYNCIPFSGNIKKFIENIFNYIFSPILLGPCFKLFKREIIQNNNIIFPEDISFGEDAEFVFNYLKYVKKIKCIDKSEYLYRKNDKESLSSKFMKEKMDLYYRLNLDLKNLLVSIKLEDNDMNNKLNKMLLNNFISYCHELFLSKENYKNKKKIFITNYEKYKINDLIKKLKKTTIAEKLIYFAYNFKVFFIVFKIFKIRDMYYMR